MRDRRLFLAVAVLLLAVPAAALDERADLRQLGYQTWRTENGLPQNTVHAILQTNDGYMWLATEGGVVRFDGFHFAIYDRQNTPVLKSNNIRALAEDRSHALWMATAGGVVCFRSAARLAFTTREGLPSDNVWAVEVDGSGKLWAATTGGLARWERGRFTPVTGGAGTVTAVAKAPSGSLLLATANGIEAFRGSAGPDVLAPILSRDSGTDVVLLDRAQRLWAASAKGLLVRDHGKTISYTTADGLPGDHVTALFEDREGSVWIGTDTGAARFAGGRLERFAPGQALATDTVLSFGEDREGDLWAGTEADGVTILRQEKFTTVADVQSPVRCVLEDRHRAVWMGTAGAGLRRFADGKFSAFTTANGLSSDQVFALAEDSAGNLLVGTPDGLDRIENGKVATLTSADGLADDFVRSIYADRDGSVWVGTRRGLSHGKNGQFETFTERDGLGSDLVGAITRARDGDLWIGTLAGLSRLRNGQFTNFTTRDGLSSNVITALHEDRAGTLWIGTEDGGLNRFQGGMFERLPASLGLPLAIYGIAGGGGATLWMAAATGIYRADVQAGDTTVVSYGTSDGLKISECTGGGHPAVWKAQDGSFWFATPKGAAELKSEAAKLNRVPPPVVIEAVSIDDRTLDPAQVSEVQPSAARLSFEYAGLSFVAPQKVTYRYRLAGFDREWIAAGARRVAYYTNLPPGRYRFEVMARNNDGIWNGGAAELTFRMLPRFYQTYWFDALVLIAACLVAYAAYRWRVREVEARFQAVLEERSRIAREIHDTLAQGFVAVSVQLEVVGRLLGASPKNAQEHLNEARTMVRDSLAQARSAIWALRSQSEEQEDLAARISKTAGQVTAHSNVKVRMKVHGTYRPVEPALEDELVGIGKEAVTNVVRHAGAENVEIELEFAQKSVRMTITDDGRGFSPAADGRGPAGHYGLQGMGERARQIHAELRVESAPGAGTRVSVEAKI